MSHAMDTLNLFEDQLEEEAEQLDILLDIQLFNDKHYLGIDVINLTNTNMFVAAYRFREKADGDVEFVAYNRGNIISTNDPYWGTYEEGNFSVRDHLVDALCIATDLSKKPLH